MLTKTMAKIPSKIKAMLYIKKKPGNHCDHSLLSPSGCPENAKDRRQNSKIMYVLTFCLLLFTGGLASCANSLPLGLGGINIGNNSLNVTPINELQQNRDATAVVSVLGQVTNLAPFLGTGAYQLQDATGTIWVLTNQEAPQVGDQLLIRGQLQFQSIPVGGQELGEVYVEELKRIEQRKGRPEDLVPSQTSES